MTIFYTIINFFPCENKIGKSGKLSEPLSKINFCRLNVRLIVSNYYVLLQDVAVVRTNEVKTRLGDRIETTETVVEHRTTIKILIRFAYITCKENVIGETIVHFRTTLYHLERWSYANFISWIAAQNEINVCICITIFHASSSIRV